MPVRKNNPWEVRKKINKMGKQMGLSQADRNIAIRGVLGLEKKPRPKIADVEGKKGDKTATLTKPRPKNKFKK
jgi:hypothetical protein